MYLRNLRNLRNLAQVLCFRISLLIAAYTRVTDTYMFACLSFLSLDCIPISHIQDLVTPLYTYTFENNTMHDNAQLLADELVEWKRRGGWAVIIEERKTNSTTPFSQPNFRPSEWTV